METERFLRIGFSYNLCFYETNNFLYLLKEMFFNKCVDNINVNVFCLMLMYSVIRLLSKLQSLLPKGALIMIYKAFVSLRFDYNDILYDQVFNLFFH